MERRYIETSAAWAGAVLAAAGTALLLPPVRRRIADLLEGRLGDLGEVEPRRAAASAGSAAAKAAVTEAGKAAAASVARQLLR